jgi:putative pyruvate formate lyase activating enzyme
LDGLVDVYLPDFKYFSSELSARYSHAPDYFEVASRALTEMHRQQPNLVYNDDGTLKNGLVVRHLVLPGCRRDSIEVLRQLKELIPTESMLLSLMSQYTPEFNDKDFFPELGRKVTTFEYESVAKEALALGFDGFFQSREAASSVYTPDFNKKS